MLRGRINWASQHLPKSDRDCLATYMQEAIVGLKNISKSYPGVVALDCVSMSFEKGEVHALVGENGAGKSTLIKVISGAIIPDSGAIFLDSKEYPYLTPQASRDLGIGVIYQEFNLVPSLSIAENIFLGNPIRKGVLVSKKEMAEKSAEILNELSIELDPRKLVKSLSVAYKQVVEIAKAVSRKIRVLIMDEPSAPLTINEVKALFELVNRLKEKGVTIIYISHRLEELFMISDRVSVLRDGKHVLTTNTSATNRQELICSMVGRSCIESYPNRKSLFGEKVLEVENLYGKGIKDASFYLRAGEILGFSGLVGSGRTELARAIFGADPYTSGEVFIEGRRIRIGRPSDAIREGIALIPEDRKLQGLLLDMSVRENICLANLRSICRNGIVKRKLQRKITIDLVESLQIKTPSIEQKVKYLSGGNQQKSVLAKWLATRSKILIFDEPTRGIDVGAKQEIYRLLMRLSLEGKGIIIISSEMLELLGITDRIYVLCEGRIVGEFSKDEATQDRILDLASGNK